jgi:DNA polymerase III delta prime subunit
MIPFVYKWKPTSIESFGVEVDTHTKINILLLGGEQTGKTTLASLIANQYLKGTDADHCLFINNLKEQGINYYRTEMKCFCQTSPSITKVVVIDEIDEMTEQAQQIFLNYMDKYGNNVKFIIVGKYSQKIIEGIFQRCFVVQMKPPTEAYLFQLAKRIQVEEGMDITDEALRYVSTISYHSVNTLFNYLEKYKLLNIPITKEYIQLTHSSIHPFLFTQMTNHIFEKQRTEAIQCILQLYQDGYSVIDILDSYFQFIKYHDISDEKKYIFVKTICKYIIIYNTIHEHKIELILFVNECMVKISNGSHTRHT